MTMAASLLYNSTHSCCKFISLTFASFVASNGCHVIIKWVGLPELGGVGSNPSNPPWVRACHAYVTEKLELMLMNA